MRRPLAFILVALFLLPLRAEEVEKRVEPWGDFQDPRQVVSLYEWIVDGSEPDRFRPINDSILIICWTPAPEELPDGRFVAYQISGVAGYHSREHVERFLDELYAVEYPPEAGVGNVTRLNVILAGNNWGAGMQLKEKLKELSREHSLSVFYAGGWAFRKAVLIEEPEARRECIRRAHERALDTQTRPL